MDVHINYLAVLLAALSSMVVGMIYYAPAVFGKKWMALAKIDEKRYQKELPRLMPVMFVAALVVAYVMAHVIYAEHRFFGNSWLSDSVSTAFWLWLGFSATTLVVHNALEQRPTKLTFISVGNRLLSFLAMGLILGWLHP